MPIEIRRYSWFQARLWLSLILYWLTCMIGAAIMAQQGASRQESSWVIFAMLTFVVVCMVTERGEWKIWQRVGFVFLAWVAQAILSIPAFFTVGMLLGGAGCLHLVDRAVAFFASIPLVVFAMRHSRLFVYLEDTSAGAQQVTSPDASLEPR